MKAIFAAIGLACALPAPAAAQLAPLESIGAPPPLEGLASMPGAAPALHEEAGGSAHACEERARSFRARNTQSPTRRQQELEACLAALDERSRVEVAGP
jgi:hypothetical protein